MFQVSYCCGSLTSISGKNMIDSIAGLEKLEELDVSSNLLVFLPDSIGLLRNLKFLNVSANKVKALPESIALCR